MENSLMTPEKIAMRRTLRRFTSVVVTVSWVCAASIGHGQSLDSHKPAPLATGVNKGNIDNFNGAHYYYFWAGPGHIDVEMAFKEMGMYGAPLRQALNFDFLDEGGKLLSHNSIVSAANLEKITTKGDFDSRRKVVLAITAQKGLVRLGGYYEVKITGAAAFEGAAGATAGVKPQSTELVHPGGQLIHPGGPLIQPGGALLNPPKGQHEP
jgi:hypothetical protein